MADALAKGGDFSGNFVRRAIGRYDLPAGAAMIEALGEGLP